MAASSPVFEPPAGPQRPAAAAHSPLTAAAGISTGVAAAGQPHSPRPARQRLGFPAPALKRGGGGGGGGGGQAGVPCRLVEALDLAAAATSTAVCTAGSGCASCGANGPLEGHQGLEVRNRLQVAQIERLSAELAALQAQVSHWTYSCTPCRNNHHCSCKLTGLTAAAPVDNPHCRAVTRRSSRPQWRRRRCGRRQAKRRRRRRRSPRPSSGL